MTSEHERHTRGRLESFSDIVFGFSLAQLALTLPPPLHFTSVRWLDMLVFAFTFAFISFIWWRHHVIFRDYFVPDTLSIILNFVLLAAVALMAYALQAYLHGHEATAPVALYAAVFGVMFLTMGLMVGRGVQKRSDIQAQTRHSGKKLSVTFTTMGIIFLTSLLLVPLGIRWVIYCWLLAPLGRAIAAGVVKREAPHDAIR